MAKINRKRAYLTKRALLRATEKATQSISLQAMNLKGYVIQAENGWIVKINKAGEKEKITRISSSNPQGQVILD